MFSTKRFFDEYYMVEYTPVLHMLFYTHVIHAINLYCILPIHSIRICHLTSNTIVSLLHSLLGYHFHKRLSGSPPLPRVNKGPLQEIRWISPFLIQLYKRGALSPCYRPKTPRWRGYCVLIDIQCIIKYNIIIYHRNR